MNDNEAQITNVCGRKGATVIKAIGIDKQGKGSIVLLGLSDVNLELLKAKKPIIVDLAEMGGTGSIVLMYGRTEADMMADLQNAEICVTSAVGTDD